jgi:hypothetical protein
LGFYEQLTTKIPAGKIVPVLTQILMCIELMNEINRNTILDSIYVLNDLVNDLVAGTMVFQNYQSKFVAGEFSQPGIVAVQNMCMSHLILALNKLCEFWDRFHNVVPAELRPEIKGLISDLQKRGVREFRNTVAAHIWDRKNQRVLTQTEMIAQLKRISGDSPGDFLRWLNSPYDHTSQKTVASMVEKLRDRLRELHSVDADEIFKR